MSSEIIIKKMVKDLESEYEYGMSHKRYAGDCYNKACAIADFVIMLLWSEGDHEASEKAENLWNDKWEVKFMELLQ